MLILVLIAGLSQIECPRWLPGTNVILPENVHLTREQKVKNLMRCYCEVVKVEESLCVANNDREECKERTDTWFRENVLPLISQQGQVQLPARRVRVISIEP